MYGKGSRGSGAAVDRLLTDIEAEFDLMRVERRMADLARKDGRLAEEIDALRASITAPEGRSGDARTVDTGLLRRCRRKLAARGRLFLLKGRRKRLAEEWRRCAAIASDIRFGLRVTRSHRG